MAEHSVTMLRISIDAKATIPIGDFSRRGKSRVNVRAVDHDFLPEQKVTPFGILLPEMGESFLAHVQK